MISSIEKIFGSPTVIDTKTTAGVTYLGFIDNTQQNSRLEFATDATDYKQQAIYMIVKIAPDPNDATCTTFSSPNGLRKWNNKFSDRTILTYKPLIY